MKTSLLGLFTGKGKSPRFGGWAMLLVLLLASTVQGQSLWNVTTSAGAWLTAGNWTPSGVPGTTGYAQFQTNPSTSPYHVGINMNGATNNGTNNQAVGAVEMTGRTNPLVIGNSSTAAGGTLTFNGTSVNGFANTILRNNTAQLLTIQNVAGSGNQTMAVALGNATANIVNIDGTGGITISSIISGANRTLTKSGTGTGILQLTGANTYTGLTTVSGGTMQLNRTGGTTLPTGNSITVSNGATMVISTAQQLANVTVDAGGILELGATLTVTGTATINGTLRIAQNGFANGAGSYTYGPAGTLEYKLTSGTYGPVDSGHVYWPGTNGPVNVTITNTGTAVVNMGIARTVSGIFTLNSGTNTVAGTALTLNGTTQINGGNFATTPTYGSASTLIYNVTYGNSNEWTGGNSNAVVAGSGVPANVTVQAGTLTLTAGRGVPGNITVNSGTTLVLNAGANNDLYLGGNFTMNGTLTNNSKAVFFVKGNAQSIISGLSSVTFDYVVIDKTGGTAVTLGAPVVINNTLFLTNGFVDLSTFNLTTGATSGASATSYVKTSSSGQLKQVVVTAAKIFPVGTTAYNPITLANNGASDTYGIVEVDGAIPNANDATFVVNRRWLVTENTPGGGNLAVVAQYNTGEEGTNFNSGVTPYLGLYTGTWTEVVATLGGANPFTASGSPFTNSISGTSSYFAIGKDTGLIAGITPPMITSFSASPNNGTSTNGYVGSTITVTGSGFTGVSTVNYNGSGGTSIGAFNVVNDTTITFAAPAGMFGTIYVSNSAGNATSSTSFTNLGYITAAPGTWQTPATWLGGSVPPSATTTNVTLAHNVTGTTATIDVAQLTINSGVTLTNTATATINVNAASTNSGTITNNGTFATAAAYTNSGTFTIGNGATFQINQGGFLSGTALSYSATGSVLTFNNTSGQYGISNGHAYWPATNGPVIVNINGAGGAQLQTGAARTVTNLNLGAGFDLQSANLLTVTGTLTINNNGSVTSNAPIYGAASALVYNTTANPYNVGTEWTGNTTTVGAGVPNNVTIQNTNNVTMPNSTRGMAGNLQILATSTLTLNGAAGDLVLAGNWTRASTAFFNCNGRAVFFSGSTTQTVTVSATGTETFNYLLVQGSGTLKLAAGTNIAVTSSGGLTLSSTNATSTIDLNGQVMTLSGGGNLDLSAGARKITSTLSGGIFRITTATTTVTNGGSLSFAAANTTVNLLNGMNFGSGLTTINGNLQIDGGGFTQTNAPVYASTSTLIYNNVVAYGVNGEWTGNATTAGAGVPQNVTITGSSINMPSSVRGLAGNLTIGTGSTLTLSGTLGADLNVAGNWNNAGTFAPASRLVTFNGGSAQTLTGATTFDYLSLNNAAGLALQPSSAVTVNQTLGLTSGKITLNANNLTIASGGTVTGGSTSNYIVTNGAGQLKMTVGGSNVTFPAGNATYNPITFNNAGTSDVYGVVVADGALTTALNNTKTVNRKWIVTEAVAGGSTLTVVAQYNTGEPNSAYNAGANPFIGFYNGTVWTQAAATESGANPFQVSTGTNTLSPSNLTAGTQYFAIGKDNAFLSVAANLVITAITPASPTAGSAFTVTVRSQDAYNSFTNVTSDTAFSLTSNGNAGTITGNLTGTILAGTSTITVSGVILPTAGTNVTVTATRTGGDNLAAGTSSAFTVQAAASQLALVNAPTTGTVNVNLATFTVEARRPNGTLDNTYTGNITITKASGPGTLSGTVTAAAVAGVATFADLKFNTAGTVTITASSGSLTPATSGNIVISLVPVVVYKEDFGTNTTVALPYSYGTNSSGLGSLDANLSTPSWTQTLASANFGGSTGGSMSSTITATGSVVITSTFNVAAGYKLTPSAILYNYRISSSGPTTLDISISGTGGSTSVSTITTTRSGAFIGVQTANFLSSTTNLTGPITLTFTLTGGASSATVRLDDVSLRGNVTCADPGLFTVTGGGAYCTGTTAPSVGLSGSQSGFSYQLKRGATNVGTAVAGTGSAISFGAQATAGTYTVEATNVTSPCNNTNTMTGNAIVTVTTSTTWTGATSTAWTDNSNWSCGAPFAASDVTIGTGTFQPAITTNPLITINSLTINSGATLRIASGFNLVVTGAIVNEGTLTVETNANLKQVNNTANSGAGNTVVHRDGGSLYRLDYTLWSSPVDRQNLLAFSPLTSNTGPSNIRFYTYNPSTNIYNVVASPGTTLMEPATGYLIRMPNTAPDYPTASVFSGVFTGTANNGPFSIAAASGQYYAVGNPYPSAIDGDAFISANSLTEALYFWRKTNAAAGSAYATYTTAGGAGTNYGDGDPLQAIPKGIIAVGQGFIAKATSSSLNFTNAMRITDNTNQFFRSALVQKHRIWIDLSNASGKINQAMIAYMPGATVGVDAAIDGKYFNDIQTALTSIIDNEEYTIQGRPAPFDVTDVVPLGFKSQTAGTFTISLNSVDGLFETDNQLVYLKDNLLNTVTNLRAGNYNFSTDAGVFNNRFEIVYQAPLATVQQLFDANNVVVFKQNTSLVINTGKAIMSTVKVFDIRGRLLAEKNNINGSETRIETGTTNQVLIVKITSDAGATVTKKVVN